MTNDANGQPAQGPDAPENTAMNTNARRLWLWLRTVMSSWIGSVVLHAALLLLLILFVPLAGQRRSASNERATENVGIVFAPTLSTSASPQDSVSQIQQPSPQTSVADIVAQHMADLAPKKEMPDIATIGAMQNAELSGNGDAGSTAMSAVSTADGSVIGSFMGVQGQGRNFVYVLDRSGSTGYGNRRSPLYVAKNELLASLQSIGEAGLREAKPIRFQIVFFNNTTAVFNTVGHGGTDKAGRLIRYDQATFEKVQRFLGSIIHDGGTQPEPALMQAVRMGADCIFFMTDGDTRITAAQLQRIQAAAKGVQINVVEYASGARHRNSNLQKLAADNNGNYVFVDLSKLPR